MACAFSLEKSRSLYLVIGPMGQKFIYLSIPQYSKTDQPIPLFGPRSPPFASSDCVFLQAKCSKIKERVEGWRSGKKLPFKRTTVCNAPKNPKSSIRCNSTFHFIKSEAVMENVHNSIYIIYDR